jgi:chromosome partitioning protein
LLTFNALRASAEVIIPVETGYFSMQGAFRQEATIEMLDRRANHKVRFKVLATMYDVRTKLAREILSELRRHFGEKLLPVVVHFNAKLKEAASFGQAITEYDPASTGYQDFEQLAQWLIANPVESPETAGALVAVGAGAVAGSNGNGNGTASGGSPALSRAAELVERARALSVRAAAVCAKLSADPDIAVEPLAQLKISDPTAQPAQKLAEKLAKVYGVRSTSQGLLFIQPSNGAASLAIAGDFNNWTPSVTPMRHDEVLGVWQAVVPVPPGRYRYRLVVDGKWVQDPYNRYVESNPFGELNNVAEMPIE